MTENTSGVLARLATGCHRHRWLVLLAWLAVAAGVIVLGATKGAPTSDAYGGGDSGADRAQQLLTEHFPGRFDGDRLTLAVHADAGLDDPAVRTRVTGVLDRLRTAPHVVAVGSPYDAPGQISADRRTAFATVALDVASDGMPVDETKQLIDDVRSADAPGVELALAGSAVNAAETPGGGAADGVGLLAAAVVLLIAFGSLLAMVVPIVTAVFGIGVGLSAMTLINHVLPAPSFGPILAALIGLGVGVDYALLIVTRYREALRAGGTPEQATATATATAGRSVLFAGTTVVICLLGLLLMKLDFMRGVAVGTALTVMLTMAAAVTLLPALLGFAGRRIDRLRLPWFGRAERRAAEAASGTARDASPGAAADPAAKTGTRPLAARWAGVIQRHPVVATVGAAVLLLLLAAPALGMRLSMPDSSTQPRDTSGYTAHRILADGFGAGYDAPLVVVAQPPGPTVDALAASVRATSGVASVSPVQVSPDHAIAMFVAYPTTSAQSEQTAQLLGTLRDEVIPANAPGSTVYVGGPTAAVTDFATLVTDRLPVLVAVVVALSLLLLVVVFRSVVLAVKAAILNLVSIGAAYGVLVAAVQWGWLTGPLGFPTAMPIAAFVPFIMFPVLFGLSMDYEVFLVSRIKEAYDRGGDTRAAVADGLTSTARVITAAAAIMVTVFLSVMLGADLAVKQLGLGMAVMVFLDATLVRMVLVPAAMELFGRANWWLPAWLDRVLPRLRLEHADLPDRTAAQPIGGSANALLLDDVNR
ncbi:MAG TPA: MMPL family transporter [Micromonosporaceae bacterium]